jgi:hypothetical protein
MRLPSSAVRAGWGGRTGRTQHHLPTQEKALRKKLAAAAAAGTAAGGEGDAEAAAAEAEGTLLRRLGRLEKLARSLAPPRPTQGPAPAQVCRTLRRTSQYKNTFNLEA